MINEGNPTMNITVINTDSGATVHRTGCRDIARDLKRHGLGPYPADHYVEEATTKREAWLDYNADFIAEGGEENAWPFHWAPCTKDLPDH